MFCDIRCLLRVTMLVLIFMVAFGTSGASSAQSTIAPERAKAFVCAALAASQVGEEWQPRIDQAKSEMEAERLREKATLAMRQAIREVDGMTVDEYRAMYHEARRNPELAAYLTDVLDEKLAETVR